MQRNEENKAEQKPAISKTLLMQLGERLVELQQAVELNVESKILSKRQSESKREERHDSDSDSDDEIVVPEFRRASALLDHYKNNQDESQPLSVEQQFYFSLGDIHREWLKGIEQFKIIDPKLKKELENLITTNMQISHAKQRNMNVSTVDDANYLANREKIREIRTELNSLFSAFLERENSKNRPSSAIRYYHQIGSILDFASKVREATDIENAALKRVQTAFFDTNPLPQQAKSRALSVAEEKAADKSPMIWLIYQIRNVQYWYSKNKNLKKAPSFFKRLVQGHNVNRVDELFGKAFDYESKTTVATREKDFLQLFDLIKKEWETSGKSYKKDSTEGIIQFLNKHSDKHSFARDIGLVLYRTLTLLRGDNRKLEALQVPYVPTVVDDEKKAEEQYRKLVGSLKKLSDAASTKDHMNECVKNLNIFVDSKVLNYRQALQELATEANRALIYSRKHEPAFERDFKVMIDDVALMPAKKTRFG